MKIIQPSFEILDPIGSKAGVEMLQRIERAGRTCYKSEDKITNDSAEKFVKNVIVRGHESVIEHEKITVRIICDRGVSHEIVRHRLASYSQESTRYCNYSSEKFGKELTFIDPSIAFDWIKDGSKECSRLWRIWEDSMNQAEVNYFELIGYGAKPEEARSALPNSIKTEIVMTMNLREIRHILLLRAVGIQGQPHPQMSEIFVPMMYKLNELIPVIFEDIVEQYEKRKKDNKTL